MNNIFTVRRLRTIAAGALLLAASLAHAQYVWIDEKGLKQFSDRPPPTNVPLKNIIKAPNHSALAPSADAAAPAAEAKADGEKKAAPTLAERNADFKKRAKDQAEKDAKAEAESKDKAARKENCEIARNQRNELMSGERFTVTDKNGERGYLDDTARAEKIAKANKVLEGCN
jgi:hypothetical protein